MITRLALTNIAGSRFRSWVVLICAFVVTSLAISTTLIVNGAQNSLRLAMDRLGADIIVVPEGDEAKVQTALLMGGPADVWMPDTMFPELAAVPGVERASPQLYLASLKDASCCAVSEMFMVAYDPTSDFTVTPWLERHLGDDLALGEAVGGTYVFVPPGEEKIMLYGYDLDLRGNMEPTGTNLDQTMFFTFETARDMARASVTAAIEPLIIPENAASSVLIDVASGVSATDVVARIRQLVPGVTPIASQNLFQTFRIQITGLLRAMVAVIAATAVVSLALMGLIFSMAANERRRESGVLRALGATRGFVFGSLIAEAGMLALAGAAPGIVLSTFCVYLFRGLIIQSFGVPFLLPSPSGMVLMFAAGLAVALAAVSLAALAPAIRTSLRDPAVAMRE